MPHLDFQPVYGRNASHDGPAQATAAFKAAGDPKKSLAQARAVCIVQARPAVFNTQRHLSVLPLNGDLDACRWRAVAHGVIDQVAHQHGQQRRVARNGAGRVALEFQRLVFANGFGCQLGHHPLRHGAKIDCRHDGCLQRFQPGQAEQLLDQARGAVAAFERA